MSCRFVVMKHRDDRWDGLSVSKFPLMRDGDAAQVTVPLPVPRTLRPDAEGLVGALPEDHAGCPVRLEEL